MQTKRWIVTYTKHMKQKRKVYHDGILELCSSSRKVILYDGQEKLIDSRFLKKDESIESDGTLAFESHLVNIGNPDGNQKTSTESNVKSSENSKSHEKVSSTFHHSSSLSYLYSGKRNVLPSEPQISHLNTACKSNKEWNVLYTSQMTQKAKRYHDGILQVVGCGSHMKQIILLNEDGATLSNKYLKSSECVETGNKCEFPNYLVEICEARVSGSASGQEIFSNVGHSCKDEAKKGSMDQVASSKTGKLLTMRKVLQKEVTDHTNSKAESSTVPINLKIDDCQNVTSNGSSKVGSFMNSSTLTSRNACQVLSFLKKPCPKEALIFGDSSVVEDLASKSSNKYPFYSQGSKQTGNSFQLGHDMEAYKEASQSVADVMKDADCEGNSSSKEFSSSVLLFGAVAADNNHLGMIKISEDSGHYFLSESTRTAESDKSISGSGCSKELIQDTNQTIPLREPLEAINGKQHLTVSTSTTMNDNIEVHANGIDGKGISSDFNAEFENSVQAIQANEMYETISSRSTESIDHAASGTIKDLKTQTTLEFTEVDDFPSFDLGF